MTFDSGTWQLIFLAISGGATLIGLLIGLIFKFVILKPIGKVEESNLELSKNIGDLATAITELQKFSSAQNERNNNDKDKIDVLFRNFEKHQVTIDRHTEEIRDNRHAINNILQSINVINSTINKDS